MASSNETILRKACLDDLSAILCIYNEGIEDQIATLDTCPKSEQDIAKWYGDHTPRHTILILEKNQTPSEKPQIIGWVSINPFSGRCCYDGVGDLSIYLARDMRGKGYGGLLLNGIIKNAKENGFSKLVLSALSNNQVGLKLYTNHGFRTVGIYEKQGILNNQTVDVTLMEKHLG